MLFRLFILSMPASMVTLCMFLLMTSILHRDDYQVGQQQSILAADFLMPEREIETMQKIEKPEKPEFKAEPQFQLPEFNLTSQAPVAEMPHFKLPKIQAEIEIGLSMPEASGDGDYMPLLKVAPLYPQRAAMRNLEGYVIVEYIVTRSGGIRDVKVIEAKPANVFNKSAIEAAQKFKYKPRKLNGEFVEVPGVRNKFTFRLEQ